MGVAEINVAGRHELKLKVASDKPIYHVRDKATIAVEVRRADGASRRGQRDCIGSSG